MKIVVTGALGHIGSKVIRELPEAFPGAEILLIDNLLTQRYCSLFNLDEKAKYHFLGDDILSANLDPLFSDAAAVIHLAAITDAATSFEKPELVHETNFQGTKRVAKACRNTGVPLVFLSTTSVYGTQREVIDEDCSPEELKPQSPYAESKLKAEEYLKDLAFRDGLRVCVLRFGTIFGISTGMRFHTAVNKFIWQAVLGQPISVWTTALDQKRPYLDLRDACRALVFVIEKNIFEGQVYNVVTLNATVRQIVEAIKAEVGDLEVKYVDSPIMNQLSYEVAKEKIEALGFSFEGNLTSGIKESIDLLAGLRSQ